jgi:hypothetical protein
MQIAPIQTSLGWSFVRSRPSAYIQFDVIESPMPLAVMDSQMSGSRKCKTALHSRAESAVRNIQDSAGQGCARRDRYAAGAG